jgi:glyoxylase I family protein
MSPATQDCDGEGVHAVGGDALAYDRVSAGVQPTIGGRAARAAATERRYKEGSCEIPQSIHGTGVAASAVPGTATIFRSTRRAPSPADVPVRWPAVVLSRLVKIVGVDHVYLAVSDFARSSAFYDRAMGALGFFKGDRTIGGDPHAHYFNRTLQLSIRPARASSRHDPYAPGLHHLCLQAADRKSIDEAHAALVALGVQATEPRIYPEYAEDYYATFFEDPDGIRHEIVARRSLREEIVREWHDLRSFLNPLQELRERRSGG